MFDSVGFVLKDFANLPSFVKYPINRDLPDQDALETLVTITTGYHDELYNAGGKLPHIALWDNYGKRIGQWAPAKNQKMASGEGGDWDGYVTVQHGQNKNKGVEPAYIMLSNHDEDAICISTISVSHGRVSTTFSSDVAARCGQTWFYSSRKLGKPEATPVCVWLDGDHTGNINAKAMSFHINDFFPSKSKMELYSQKGLEGFPYLCHSTPRFSFWGNLLPNGNPPFFLPPLKYKRDGKDEGADEDPDAALDRKTYDKGVYLNQGEKNGSSNRRKRRIGKRSSPNMNPEKLIVTQIEGQTARQVCESATSVGFDIVSHVDHMFCDISERKLYPLCTYEVTSNCFNLNSTVLIGESGPLLTARGEPAKAYKDVAHWK
ncbi:hypothetical protein C8035_v005151 [Colletotrichum spinosum]|uniref:Uncharacterized protein n=1 Tax=Colletotrichum spinosum TaxID=1347390 RepID=A0A4R8QD97_9PEZI|nr:hypothetical protein C8035_v005151 [Colletotrichum spinosum]